MKKISKILFLLLLLSALRYPLSATYAEVPHLINYQGRLTDTGGVPLNGSYNLTFRIYDAETAGNLLWEETQPGVIISKGIFAVSLGSVTNLNIAFDKPYFLEIKIGNEVMTPRQRITSAGYAIRADSAEKIKASGEDTSPGALDAKVKNSVIIDSNQLQLFGDAASPGNDKVYGTDNNGVKGWRSGLSFGAWVSKSNNTVYRAETDGFVIGYGAPGYNWGIYSDSSNPPTTTRQYYQVEASAHDYGCGMCPIRKGDYYKTVGFSKVYWMPLGR